MKVPLLDLRAQYATLRDAVREAMDRVIDSQQFILGPEVSALESEIAHYTGTAYAVGVSSGTDALLVTLIALGIEPGDEVVTTPFSFFATAGVITRLGARPVFADIDPVTFNIDAQAAGEACSPRTRVLLPVHLFGRLAEMDALIAVARTHGITVVEDAAQAIGAEDERGRCGGAIGHAGCLSFFPTKNLGAFGDAGMVVSNDKRFADAVELLRVHGMRPKYHHHVVGGNFRLDALQAAVLRAKLPFLGTWTTARRHNATRYRALFADAGLADGRIILPADVPGHSYHQFVIRVRERDTLRAHLAKAGVGTEVYYPIPLHMQPCFRDLGYAPGDFPAAETAANEVLALPIYPELTEAAQAYVVQSIHSFFDNRTRQQDSGVGSSRVTLS